MMEKVDPGIREEIRKLGASELQACYSCGNCSAVCPLSEGEASFPRKMIRYALLGLENRLISSPEPWLCYYCGECSDTCPREADPGGLMMALRRFAIRRYSAGRIADVFYTSFASGIAWIALSLIAALAIFLFHNPAMNLEEVDFLSFVTLERIHNTGLGLGAFIGIAFLMNITIMVRALRRGMPDRDWSLKRLAVSFVPALKEALAQRRFGECEGDGKRYWAHMSLMWGFVGMFIATVLVMGIDYEILPISRSIPFAFGSVFGVVTLYGTFYYILQRIKGESASAKKSHVSDWAFLILILLTVLSGFLMDLFKVLDMPRAAYWTFAFHMVTVFDLLVSLPFTKFAHMIYRPVALWLSGLE